MFDKLEPGEIVVICNDQSRFFNEIGVVQSVDIRAQLLYRVRLVNSKETWIFFPSEVRKK